MSNQTGSPGNVPALSPVEAQKRAAGRRAVEFVADGQVVGLGSGTTVRYAVEALGERVRQGLKIVGVATSASTADLAKSVGIPLADLNDCAELDVAIDGADEIDPHFNLIKGLGAALVREKLVEVLARILVVVADDGKLVPLLGTKAPVPTAVFPFGWRRTVDRLAGLGCRPVRRERAGEPIVTDDGMYVVDCWFGGMSDPAETERQLMLTPGVAATGLFLGFPVVAVVAYPDGQVKVTQRQQGSDGEEPAG